MKPPLYTLYALLIAVAPTLTMHANDTWNGKSGEELRDAVAADCMPLRTITTPLGAESIWALLAEADGSEGCFVNRFSDEPMPLPESADTPPRNAALVPAVTSGWWEINHPYGNLPASDLYNLFPAETWVGRFKADLPPGIVESGEIKQGNIKKGHAAFNGSERQVWEPSDRYKGDFARVLMYMVTVYHSGIIPFGGPASGYFVMNSFPLLSQSAMRLLLAWHRADPVSDLERGRNQSISRAQGNENPFVSHPELAEYLWGYRQGEAYGTSAPPPDTPDVPDPGDNSPLRAVYRLTESRINLASPFIPDDAVWTVDGATVSGPYLIPSELGEGNHLLEFRAAECYGRLTVLIAP